MGPGGHAARWLRECRDILQRRLTPATILVIGWLLFLVYAYPGYMSADSTYQLAQARGSDPISDWHPPMMAVIWRYLDKLIAGPVLMLVLQSVTFLLGLYVVLRHLMSKRAAAIAAALVLLSPQNIHIMAVIWKDSLMAGLLLAGLGALLSDQRRVRVGGYLLLLLATTVRYNAAAPTFPIIMLLWNLRGTQHWLKRYACAFAVWIGITVAAFVVNGLVTEIKVHPWPTGAAPVDIYGALHFAEDIDTAQLLRDFPEVPWVHSKDFRHTLDAGYARDNTYYQSFETETAILKYPTTPEHRAGITRLWRMLLFEHPGAFLRHRLLVFELQLKNVVRVWTSFTNADWAEANLNHRATHSAIQLQWAKSLRALVGKRVFRPHMYFVLALVFLLLCRGHRLAFAVLASGVAHEIGLFLLAPAVDYRYSHWMVMSTVIGGIILFTGRLSGKDKRA